jgi:hypothetical protein
MDEFTETILIVLCGILWWAADYSSGMLLDMKNGKIIE